MLEEVVRVEKEPSLNPSYFCSDSMLRCIHGKLYDSANALVAIQIALFGEVKLTNDARDKIEAWGNIQPETLSEFISSINTGADQVRDLADELRVRIGG